MITDPTPDNQQATRRQALIIGSQAFENPTVKIRKHSGDEPPARTQQSQPNEHVTMREWIVGKLERSVSAFVPHTLLWSDVMKRESSREGGVGVESPRSVSVGGGRPDPSDTCSEFRILAEVAREENARGAGGRKGKRQVEAGEKGEGGTGPRTV
eukprot:1506150-Amphidinium_carterae.3